MPRLIKAISVCTLMLAVIFGILYAVFGVKAFLTAAVTCGTTAYHFIMRLTVGFIFNKTMRNRADYDKPFYQLHDFEKKLYKALRVKSWKGKMPTYAPESFDPKLHSWDEIAQAMCQAELVHETIIILSFLPLLAAIYLGDFWIFFLTSLAAALFDLTFVIIQRYNRPRVVRMAKRQKRSRK